MDGDAGNGGSTNSYGGAAIDSYGDGGNSGDGANDSGGDDSGSN